MSTTLTVRTLGDVAIELNGKRLSGFASRKAEALFIYLACSSNATPIPRDVLATLLWSDNTSSRALANLSVMLSSLRKQLGDYIETTRHTVAFVPQENSFIDAVAFQQAVDNAALQERKVGKLTRSVAAQFASGLAHYQGDFLLGFSVRRAPEFESWVLLEQERLRQSALSVIETLITYHAQRSQLKEAIDYAQRLVQTDSLNEVAQRQLISLLAQDGQQAAALAQHEACRAVLADELGVEPDEETEALAAAVRNGSFVSSTKLKVVEVAAAPTNVPHDVTRFFGRTSELTHIEQRLNDPYTRLLTLIGAGGIGKSRLAREVGRSVAAQFQHGVRYVSLAAVNKTSALFAAIADAVGLTFSGRDGASTQLLRHLRDREMLLILDNFEQLIVAETLDFIGALVRDSADMRLIITSRERLKLQAEVRLEIRGMRYQATGDSELSDAGLLFADRARRLRHDIEIERGLVDTLCRAVDGLPLALELAAGWAHRLSLAEIVVEAQRGLDLLATSFHDIPTRHRSIRAVFERSWQLLPPATRDLYARLAVLCGGFTLDAAEAIADATEAQLTSLIEQSLLWTDQDGRYFRHPLLVEFSAEKLPPDKTDTQQQRHTDYFAHWLDACRSKLQGEQFSGTMGLISADEINLTRAFRHAVSREQWHLLTLLVPTLCLYFKFRSRFFEIIDLLQLAQQQLTAAPDRGQQLALLNLITLRLAQFNYYLNNFEQALTLLDEAQTLSEQLGAQRELLTVLHTRGAIAGEQGDHATALVQFEQGLLLARQGGDRRVEMTLLQSTAVELIAVGHYDEARQAVIDSLAMDGRELSNNERAQCYNILGTTERLRGEHAAADEWLQQSAELFRETNYPYGIGMSLLGLSQLKLAQRDVVQATQHIEESLSYLREVKRPYALASALVTLGRVRIEQEEVASAETTFRDALQAAQKSESASAMLEAICALAMVASLYQQTEQAIALFAFVEAHAATSFEVRQWATEWLAKIRGRVSTEAFTTAQAKLNDHSLKTVTADLQSLVATS